jgi:homoserine kinase
MQKIKIRLPATMTDFGVGIGHFGLAIGLYTQVEISPREDERLVVEPYGEGAGDYALALRHPVMLAMMRLFQREERAPLGITLKIQNDIPLNVGLGAEVAFTVAGVLGANNLLGNLYRREELVRFACDISQRPANAITAMLGGLTCYSHADDGLRYQNLDLTAFKVILAIPKLENYAPPPYPASAPMPAILHTLSRLPFFLRAFKQGDPRLLAEVIDDPLYANTVSRGISGFAHVSEVARLAGALGVMTSGGGTAMVFLAHRAHDRIAEVVESAFNNLDIRARVQVVPLDTQGVVISMMQSS